MSSQPASQPASQNASQPNDYQTIQTNPAIGERGKIDIFKPDTQGPHPFVLAIHGGGWHAGNRSSYHWVPKRLLQRGMAVVTCSYRLIDEAKFPAAYDDLVHLLNWLATNAQAQGLRSDGCVILGGSAGGHLVCLLSTRGVQENKETFIPIKGVVSYCPVVDMEQQYEFDQVHGRNITEDFLGGKPDEKAQRYHDASPIKFLDKDAPPLWIAHGDQDDVVPVQATLDYTKTCHKFGTSVTTYIAPGLKHTMTEPDTTPPVFLQEESMVAFVGKCLNLPTN